MSLGPDHTMSGHRPPLGVFFTLIAGALFLLSSLLAVSPSAFAQTAVGTVTVGTAPYCVGVNTATNKTYVANAQSNTVSVINGSTNAVIHTVNVGAGPLGVGVNSATNKIYVANRGDNTVSVINGVMSVRSGR